MTWTATEGARRATDGADDGGHAEGTGGRRMTDGAGEGGSAEGDGGRAAGDGGEGRGLGRMGNWGRTTRELSQNSSSEGPRPTL
jgi:hypothetical protein